MNLKCFLCICIICCFSLLLQSIYLFYLLCLSLPHSFSFYRSLVCFCCHKCNDTKIKHIWQNARDRLKRTLYIQHTHTHIQHTHARIVFHNGINKDNNSNNNNNSKDNNSTFHIRFRSFQHAEVVLLYAYPYFFCRHPPPPLHKFHRIPFTFHYFIFYIKN